MDEAIPAYRGYKIVRLPTGWYRAVGYPDIPDCPSVEELHKAIDQYIRRKSDPSVAPDVEPDGPRLGS